MSIKFSDGLEIASDGPLRVIKKADGFYVIGEDLVCAVESREDGQRLIRELLTTRHSNTNGN